MSIKRVLRKCLILALKTIGTGIDQNKNHHLLDPLDRKCSFYMRIYSFWWLERIFHWKGKFFETLCTFDHLCDHTFDTKAWKYSFSLTITDGFCIVWHVTWHDPCFSSIGIHLCLGQHKFTLLRYFNLWFCWNLAHFPDFFRNKG